MVYGTNLLQALPEPKQTVEAIQKLDFLVAIDVLPAEIGGWADVVLPEATYLERCDDVAPPPYKSRSSRSGSRWSRRCTSRSRAGGSRRSSRSASASATYFPWESARADGHRAAEGRRLRRRGAPARRASC